MTSSTPTMRTAWLTVALLWPVVLLNYLDRQMIATMKTSVVADVDGFQPPPDTDADWGYMLGLFKWSYALLSPVGGFVADRFGRRPVIGASLIVWSAVTWVTGQVTTYDGLLWTRTLMGFSEAFYFPAALALIADFHTGPTRSRAVGLHQTGMYCGVILGGFGGYVADAPALGWRFAFDTAGLVGIAYALPLLVALRPAPRAANAFSDKPDPISAAKQLAKNASFLLLVLYFTFPALAGWVIRDWMPAILKERFELGQGTAGVSATLYWTVAALVGVYLGGFLADRASRHSARGRIYVSAAGMAMIVPALFGVGHATSLELAVAFLVLFGLGWGFFDCNNMPILAQIVRPNLRATGYGVMNLVSISCGGFADLRFGQLKSAGVPVSYIFLGLSGFAVVSIVLVLLIRPKPDLIDRPNVTPV
jgi:MFS family permease